MAKDKVDQLKTKIVEALRTSNLKAIITLAKELTELGKENVSEEAHSQIIDEYQSIITPLLHQAAQENNLETVRCLLQSNINLNVQDEQGRTALYWAKYNKATNVENYLLGYQDGYEAGQHSIDRSLPSLYSDEG